MIVLTLVLLVALAIFFLGLFVWVVFEHFLTAQVPRTLKHRVKFRILHCFFLYAMDLGNVLEKLRICSMPRFICFVHDIVMRRKKDPQVLVTDLRFGTIPVRLFQPKAASRSPRRGIVFYHGGGGMFGSLECYHNLCSFLARETDSVLISVGYRKLPDQHYPVITHDCLNASIYFLRNLESYGVDPARVVICGESIGAGAVAQVTQALVAQPDLPQVRAQILIYPVIQGLNFQLPSIQRNANTPFLTRDLLITFICKYMTIDLSWKDAMLKGTCIHPDVWKKYRKWLSWDNIPKKFKNNVQEPLFPGPFNETAYLEVKHLYDVENEPILADDDIVAQLPEAFVVSCENDTLRDDALLYKKRLEDNGIPVTWYHVEDGFHACLVLFSKKCFSFPCTLNIANAVVGYIKGI
ncbi:arylacetamide deacetylase-like 4 [Ctenodactylus gundi]